MISDWFHFLFGSARLLPPHVPAPEFALPDQENRIVQLSDFRGRHVVLWFYVKADTPG